MINELGREKTCPWGLPNRAVQPQMARGLKFGIEEEEGLMPAQNEPCHEKTCLQAFRQGLTQTLKMAKGLKFRMEEGLY